jgi:predicted metal-dependent TIM-barrel fold hydrolase
MGTGLVKFLDKIASVITGIFKPKDNLKVAFKQPPRDDYEYNRLKNIEQQEVNRILEKIGKAGYDSLSKNEKEILFKQGKK